MNSEIEAFILTAIQKKSKLPANCDLARFDYLASGHVDSVAIIQFILDLEMKFDIDIREEDLESPEFRTVAGLARMIAEKCATR
jgi:acyl carrier protein